MNSILIGTITLFVAVVSLGFGQIISFDPDPNLISILLSMGFYGVSILSAIVTIFLITVFIIEMIQKTISDIKSVE